MKWIEVDENIINLDFVVSITKDDREVAYAKPFLLVFEAGEKEYFLDFETREKREVYRKYLMKKLKAIQE